jgi:hypothetical protein
VACQRGVGTRGEAQKAARQSSVDRTTGSETALALTAIIPPYHCMRRVERFSTTSESHRECVGIPRVPLDSVRHSSRQPRLAVCHRAVRLPKTLDISACQTRTQGTSTKARTDSGYSGASQLFVVGISALLGIAGFRIEISMASFCKGGGVRMLASSMACVSMADTVLLTARYSFRLLAIKFPNIMSRRSAHLSGSW